MKIIDSLIVKKEIAELRRCPRGWERFFYFLPAITCAAFAIFVFIFFLAKPNKSVPTIILSLVFLLISLSIFISLNRKLKFKGVIRWKSTMNLKELVIGIQDYTDWDLKFQSDNYYYFEIQLKSLWFYTWYNLVLMEKDNLFYFNIIRTDSILEVDDASREVRRTILNVVNRRKEKLGIK